MYAIRSYYATVPTYWLNGRHTIFGYVTKGYDVLKALESVPTTGQYRGNKPLEDQKIISITIK